MTAGLAESMNLARPQGLDLEAFLKVLDAGPLASAYPKLKIAKMLNQDWSLKRPSKTSSQQYPIHPVSCGGSEHSYAARIAPRFIVQAGE